MKIKILFIIFSYLLKLALSVGIRESKSSNYPKIIEIEYQNEWLPLCYNQIDKVVSDLICKSIKGPKWIATQTAQQTTCNGAQYVVYNELDQIGNNFGVDMQNQSCDEDDKNLGDCLQGQSISWRSNNSCNQNNQCVSVNCKEAKGSLKSTNRYGDYQMKNSNLFFNNGQYWLSMNDQGFFDLEAMFVCQQLGHYNFENHNTISCEPPEQDNMEHNRMAKIDCKRQYQSTSSDDHYNNRRLEYTTDRWHKTDGYDGTYSMSEKECDVNYLDSFEENSCVQLTCRDSEFSWLALVISIAVIGGIAAGITVCCVSHQKRKRREEEERRRIQQQNQGNIIQQNPISAHVAQQQQPVLVQQQGPVLVQQPIMQQQPVLVQQQPVLQQQGYIQQQQQPVIMQQQPIQGQPMMMQQQQLQQQQHQQQQQKPVVVDYQPQSDPYQNQNYQYQQQQQQNINNNDNYVKQQPQNQPQQNGGGGGDFDDDSLLE